MHTSLQHCIFTMVKHVAFIIVVFVLRINKMHSKYTCQYTMSTNYMCQLLLYHVVANYVCPIMKTRVPAQVVHTRPQITYGTSSRTRADMAATSGIVEQFHISHTYVHARFCINMLHIDTYRHYTSTMLGLEKRIIEHGLCSGPTS